MTEHDPISDRIEQALRGRAARRDEVTATCDALRDLTTRFTGLVQDVAALGPLVGDAAGGDTVRDDLRARFGDGPYGRAYTDAVGSDLVRALEQAEKVRRRVNRDAVNIGVVGMMKAGKSTLLRSITGLDRSVIPSAELGATTAALSRIVNHSGPAQVRISRHTWPSFRAEYLQPLHEAADCGPVPATLDEFAAHRYPEPRELTDDQVSQRQFLKKLHEARQSLPSYRDNLVGGPLDIELAQVEPFVAYPRTSDPAAPRPYHAVREIEIRTAFPDVPAARIGLIDLPGAGEAGLDVDRHFLRRLHNDVDLLLMVKWPEGKDADMTAADWKVVELATEARSGVPMEHFFIGVLNRRHDAADDGPDARRFDHALGEVRNSLKHTAVTVYAVNADVPAEVRGELVGPVLDNLARHLADMDRAALEAVRDDVADVLGRIVAYVTHLDERLAEWRRTFGGQRHQLEKAADDLRQRIGKDLLGLVDSYLRKVEDGEPDAVMMKAVEAAQQDVRGWMPAFVAEVEAAPRVDFLRTVQDDFRAARVKLDEAFGRIEPSRKNATAELYRDVAAVLRTWLKPGLVGEPDDPATLPSLQRTAGDRGATRIAEAIADLLELDTGYGNVVLRVGRPLISQVSREDGRRRGADSDVEEDDRARSRREALGLPPKPAAQAGQDAGGSHIPRDVPELVAALQTDVESCLTALHGALQTEARSLNRVLASAAERFTDRLVRTNDVRFDFQDLCEEHQVEIWPDLFGGPAARAAEALAKLSGTAQDVRAQADSIRMPA